MGSSNVNDVEKTEKQWKSIYILGFISTIIGLVGILLDVVIGNITGGNLSALPQTAVERFSQLQSNPLLGLYNLDILNIINQLLLIPAYFALYAAHRKVQLGYACFAFIVLLTGTMIFVTTNTALPMLELSNKYFATQSETQKLLFAAAGEAMLVRGSHGSLGVFIGFVLPNVGGLLMSLVMLKGKIFSQSTAYLGIAGSSLLLIYLLIVTFASVKSMATLIAMPGGLMSMAWMILFAIRLLKLGAKIHDK